jgi:hypothetical protein
MAREANGKKLPVALEGMPPSLIAAFERDFKAATTKRRKCSREDWASGYVTCYRVYFGSGRKRKPPAPLPEEEPQEDWGA